jgi:hypothetical protein
MNNGHVYCLSIRSVHLNSMINKYLVLVGYIERNAHIVLESYLPTTHASRVSDLEKFFLDIKVMIKQRGMP